MISKKRERKSLANKTTNFINESHLLIWGKLQLGLTRQRHENRLYIFVGLGSLDSSELGGIGRFKQMFVKLEKFAEKLFAEIL